MRLRTGIQRYNLSQGNLTGYHETITLAWIAILSRALRHHKAMERSQESEAASAQALAVAYPSQSCLLEHYTRERLMSEEARVRWVPPDRLPIE